MIEIEVKGKHLICDPFSLFCNQSLSVFYSRLFWKHCFSSRRRIGRRTNSSSAGFNTAIGQERGRMKTRERRRERIQRREQGGEKRAHGRGHGGESEEDGAEREGYKVEREMKAGRRETRAEMRRREKMYRRSVKWVEKSGQKTDDGRGRERDERGGRIQEGGERKGGYEFTKKCAAHSMRTNKERKLEAGASQRLDKAHRSDEKESGNAAQSDPRRTASTARLCGFDQESACGYFRDLSHTLKSRGMGHNDPAFSKS